MVGSVGRLVAEKGYPELFEAFERLPGRFRLVVVGGADPEKPDSLAPEIIDRARARGVLFLGQRDDVDRLYSAMDVFVLASHREGFPRAAMEATAMGLPVVATDIRGCREVVDPGVTGSLVPVRDPSALASTLLALSDPSLRSRHGHAAIAACTSRGSTSDGSWTPCSVRTGRWPTAKASISRDVTQVKYCDVRQLFLDSGPREWDDHSP